jgi:predicted nuclease of predicted toxin-antitoxin system
MLSAAWRLRDNAGIAGHRIMRILFDQGTPVPLRRALTDHSVFTAHEMGWTQLDNGALLQAAEAEFDVLVTTDQNLPYQQNLTGRRIAILILPTTSWPKIERRQAQIVAAVGALRPGDVLELKLS